jgi:tetratricopeptide (TPR) repeat protein
MELRKYISALKVLESIDGNQRSEEEMNEILELRFACYFANHSNTSEKCTALLPLLANRTLTPKLHILAAEAYIRQDTAHKPDHPAIPHLLEVLQLYPNAIELAEKLLAVGASLDLILSHMHTGPAKLFMQSLQHSARSEFERAISSLNEIIHAVTPLPVCAINQICINAIESRQLELFDSTAVLIPIDDLEIADVRAHRFKQLRKLDELNQLALHALNTDETHPNAWLAFSHLLELNGDHQRALQTTRKALVLDHNSRRAYMRHGELRMQRNDFQKAVTSFVRAHQLHEGIDSYTAIVQCYCNIEDWPQAESYAARAVISYPFESEHGGFSLTLMGLALRGRDLNKAIRLLRKAIEKGGSSLEAVQALVDIKMKETDLDGAEAVLREFQEQSGEFFFSLKMGEIYGMRRDFHKALEFVSNAARLEPNNQIARSLLEQIESMLRDRDSEFDAEEEGISF